MYKNNNENTVNDIRSSDDVLADLFGEDFQAASLSQKEATESTDNSKETLQELTSDDISSVIPTFSGLISNPSQMDDDFIDLDPPTPATGSRNLIKIANIRQETNQLTSFGVKTVTSIDMDCYWGDDQIYRVSERFYRNAGDPISGRFKSFCTDLFKAFDLKRAHLSDLIGRECTAIITYVPSQNGEVNYPRLSDFKKLD